MRTTSISLLASVCLVLAACGGDDGASDGIAIDGPAGVDDQTEPPEAELAPDAADAPGSGDLEELLDGLDDMITRFGGDGGGYVTVGDVTYTVDADVCIAQPTDFTLDGPAAGSDGSAAWVSVDYTLMTRDDMRDFIDDATLEFMFPDGVDVVEDMTVEVNVGQTARFESVDDQPAWISSGGSLFEAGTITYEISGTTIRGAGEAEDWNYVAVEWGETVQIEFEVGCS